MNTQTLLSLVPVRRLILPCSFMLFVSVACVRGQDPPEGVRARRGERPPGVMPVDSRRVELRELRESRERLLAELREARAQGRDAEAAELKEKIVGLEREITQLERRPVLEMRPRGEQPGRPAPERGGRPEQRHQHLREAVEHLHAAGLPDIAEKVGQAGEERLKEEMRPQPGVPPEVVEELHNQINELRERVAELQGQVERLSRDRD